MVERRFQRVPFQTEAEVIKNGVAWNCTLLNIALKGALLECGRLPLDIGEIYDIRLILPGTGISLGFRSELVHCADDRCGFKFVAVDLETLTHLRRLLELNTGDVDCVRGELMTWLGED